MEGAGAAIVAGPGELGVDELDVDALGEGAGAAAVARDGDGAGTVVGSGDGAGTGDEDGAVFPAHRQYSLLRWQSLWLASSGSSAYRKNLTAPLEESLHPALAALAAVFCIAVWPGRSQPTAMAAAVHSLTLKMR